MTTNKSEHMNTIYTNKHFEGFERHLKILQALNWKSIQLYLAKLQEFFWWLEEKKGKLSLKDITRHDVEAYLEWCFYKGNGNHTRITKLIAITKFFRYLEYEKVIHENVANLIPKPRVKKTFVQKFTKEDVLKFFRSIDITTEKGIRDTVLYILAAFCGLRCGEIINLRLYDIIDHGRSVDINVIESKHNSSRTVALWSAPSVFVKQWLTIRIAHGGREDSPLLVSYKKGAKSTGRKITPEGINKEVKTRAKKAGIRKSRVHVHMFRATHATDLRSVQRYDTPAIAQRLGHKNIITTDRYFPTRGRVHRIYRSLSEYWFEFTKIWSPQNTEDIE